MNLTSAVLDVVLAEREMSESLNTHATGLDKADIHPCSAIQSESGTHRTLFPRG
jgi:hypothetical protein